MYRTYTFVDQEELAPITAQPTDPRNQRSDRKPTLGPKVF